MQAILSTTDYTFVASTKKITLVAPFNTLDEERILKITNLTKRSIIYDSERRTHSISVAAGVVTCTYDSTGMANGDDLQIIVDLAEPLYKPTYQAASAANVVVSASPAFLHSIIVGLGVTGGIIEVSDHATDGDGAVRVYLEDADVGTYIIDAAFAVGICADLTLQTNVTFVWR
jgi:hypothetical protein